MYPYTINLEILNMLIANYTSRPIEIVWEQLLSKRCFAFDLTIKHGVEILTNNADYSIISVAERLFTYFYFQKNMIHDFDDAPENIVDNIIEDVNEISENVEEAIKNYILCNRKDWIKYLYQFQMPNFIHEKYLETLEKNSNENRNICTRGRINHGKLIFEIKKEIKAITEEHKVIVAPAWEQIELDEEWTKVRK